MTLDVSSVCFQGWALSLSIQRLAHVYVSKYLESLFRCFMAVGKTELSDSPGRSPHGPQSASLRAARGSYGPAGQHDYWPADVDSEGKNPD